ncbi:MAG: glycosyltransferase family 1 protein [Chloroflexota bacterium]|nr:glycosyltransferase family 1 protein [Chloroflexota bacterium]
MRIGIDARMVYYTQAGISQYTQRLIRALAEVDRENEYFIIQNWRDKVSLSLNHNFKRVSFVSPAHHRLEQWFLRFELPPLDLDVLHSPDFIPPFRRNCKSVITVHDLAFLLYPQLLTEDSAHYYGQIDQAVRRTDHIIAVSQNTKEDIIRLLGVPEDKITVIYEAANPIYRPVEDEGELRRVRGKYSVAGDFIFFVSTIEPRKNVPALLRAFRQLIDDYKLEVKLVIAGRRGWLFEEVFSLVEELELTGDVLFLGRVPVEDLPPLYTAARLFAYPSTYEGFGLPPLEAMACGTPIVASNVSSLPEVVGDAALLVAPDDVAGLTVALWRGLTDEARRAELVAKGFRRAKCFSWEKAARQTSAVYQSLLSSR